MVHQFWYPNFSIWWHFHWKINKELKLIFSVTQPGCTKSHKSKVRMVSWLRDIAFHACTWIQNVCRYSIITSGQCSPQHLEYVPPKCNFPPPRVALRGCSQCINIMQRARNTKYSERILCKYWKLGVYLHNMFAVLIYIKNIKLSNEIWYKCILGSDI